jgi:hypothetical protein
MSQHKYRMVKDGKEINVMAGWARPLQYIFLMVEVELLVPKDLEIRSQEAQDTYWDEYDEAHEFLYNNLRDGNPPTAEAVREILTRLGLPVPEGFVAAIQEDACNNEGNKVVNYLAEVAG